MNSLLNYNYPSVHANTPSVVSYKSVTNYFLQKNYKKIIVDIGGFLFLLRRVLSSEYPTEMSALLHLQKN